MTTAEEIEALKSLPGLYPETIELLNRAAAAAKTKPTTQRIQTFEEWEANGGDTDGIARTVCHACGDMAPVDDMTENDRFDNICPNCTPPTTMTTTEEIHAAAVKNVEGNHAAAIVHILNVLRKLPPSITTTRHIATQWKQPHHYFTDSLGKAYCANCRQPQPASEAKRIVWSIDKKNPARWRGHMNGTTICLFIIDRNDEGTFDMAGGIIPDGEDWNGPNEERTMEDLQAQAETYVAEFQAILNR